MSWDQIQNHQAIVERFRRNVQRNRLASTYLFVGPDGIGKRMFATKLAEALFCEQNLERDLAPCGQCPSCLQVQAHTHPDLILVSKPRDKSNIPVDLFIGTKEHRRQSGLIHDLGLKPFYGRRKIAIIDDADYLAAEGANSLLKTLEEPPPNTLLILIGTSQQRQLSTIVSRSQVVRFEPLTNAQVQTILERGQHVESDIPLADLANASGGSIDRAIKLSDLETFEFRKLLHSQLAGLDPHQAGFYKTVTDFVDAAGKDASKKRARLVMVGDFAIEFYRHWYLRLACANLNFEQCDPNLDDVVDSTIHRWENDIHAGSEIAAQCIKRCTQMQDHVFANSSAKNNVEVWLRDLGRIGRGEPTAIAGTSQLV